MPNYARADIAFERGEGPYLFTAEGRRYLDFAAGVAVNALGHGHPHLVAALVEQAKRVWHYSNLYRVPGQEQMAARLVERTFADTVFFCNSGAEAVEASLKMARKYQDHVGSPERYRVITFENAFHGRTLATISAGTNAAHQKGFDPLVQGFDHCAFGNMNEVRAKITGETAAILVEPVQGEGGIHPAPRGFLKALREACDEHGLLLVFDEVQTGMGRTGKLFAYEWEGIAPDVMAVAKGIGGGFPIGACLATERAAAAMTAGTHGSTFGGNLLAMAAANAVLDVMLAPGFFERVQETGRYLGERLAATATRFPKAIETVRGTGMMWGVKCVVPYAEMTTRLRDHGLLTVPAGDNVVRFLPPLNIERAQVDDAVTALEKAAASFA
ncbi:MAG: aspartate aminotransferase family protein [Alphaproteobacteria bacterium]|nr:aspartate aminotransferase family protein [Alphaproteobacteria bacterium]